MLGRDARGGASQGPQSASAGRSAAEREREQRMQQLAAWRLQKEQQQRENLAKSSPMKTAKQPFNTTMASSAQSDAEKQRLLQRRKELMRPPSTKKSAQSPAREAPSPRREKPSQASTTATTSRGAVAASAASPLRKGPGTDSHEQPAPQSPLPVVQRDDPGELRGSDPDGLRIPSTQDDEARSQAKSHVPEVQDATTAARLSPEIPPLQRRLFSASNPPVPTTDHRTPASYAPRPPPPRVVRLPDALVVDKRPPMRSPAKSSQVKMPVETTASFSSSEENPPVTSPDAASGRKTAILKTQQSPAKASKQVRFVDDVQSGAEHEVVAPVESQASVGGHVGEAATAEDDDQDEQPNPLVESQSSVDREIQQTEVLMSEVDELLSYHKTEEIITDHDAHLHDDSEGRAQTEEKITEVKTEESTLVQVEEKVVVLAPPVITEHPAEMPPMSSPVEPSVPVIIDPPQKPVEPTKAPTLHVAPHLTAPTTDSVPLFSESPSPSVDRVQVTQLGKTTKHNWRKIIELSLVLISVLILDFFYPWSPVSKGIRVIIRVATAVTLSLTSRVLKWIWGVMVRPTMDTMCAKFADADGMWSPSAHALQSLVHDGRASLSSLFRRDSRLSNFSMSQYGYAIFHGISSVVADAILYAAQPLLKPLPTFDSSATADVEKRLEDLNAVQQQLPVAVEEIVKAHEEWALAELARMKRRRMAYATVTQSLLDETSKTMLAAVREAKLIAAEHIQAFTNQLASELMASIEPELEAYEQSQVEASREGAELDADVKKERLEAAARLEILRVEVAKKLAGATVGVDVATALDKAGSVLVEEVKDGFEEQIRHIPSSKVVIDGDEIRTAEELARESLMVEESLLLEAAEAQRILDEFLTEDVEQREHEPDPTAEQRTEVESIEVDQLVAEIEVVEKTKESEVVKVVEYVEDESDSTDSEIIEGTAGEASVVIAEVEIERQEATLIDGEATAEIVVAQVEEAIGASLSFEHVSGRPSLEPLSALHPTTVVTGKKVYDETELMHMVLLSIGFTVLAIVTAFVLFPRWSRLPSTPTKDAKQWIFDRRQRRRRRSWQRPADVTDSEPEEVTLLETGSPSDDSLFESNEPEPEVVEFMSEGTAASRVSRASFASYSRQSDGSERVESVRVETEGEEELVSDTSQRGGTRRRTLRAI